MFSVFKSKYPATIIPQYEPPAEITAAELGMLFDGKGGRLEFLATLYQFKTRRYISLQKQEDGEVTLTLLDYKLENLETFEDLLMRFMFHESKQVLLSSITTGCDSVALQSYFNYLVLQSLGNKNMLLLDSTYTLAYNDYLIEISRDPIRFMREIYKGLRPRAYTEYAKSLMPVLLGFKQYIETAELEKIKFHAKGNLDEYIEVLTPYAIAFDQMKRWEIIGIPFVIKLEVVAKTEDNISGNSNDSVNEIQGFYTQLSHDVSKIDNYKIK